MSDDQVTRMLVLLRKQRDAAEAQCDALTVERDLLATTLTRARELATEVRPPHRVLPSDPQDPRWSSLIRLLDLLIEERP